MNIRRESIKFSKKLARRKRAKEKELKAALAEAEEKMNINDNYKDIYFNLKEEYETFEKERARGSIIRSKARWVEEGERNTKYFMSLEKHNQDLKHIKVLTDSNGQEVKGKQNILDYIKDYYTNIYNDNPLVSKNETDFQNFGSDIKLDNEDKMQLDKPFSESEIREALDGLPNGKTPGIDGFNTDFYKYFWPKLKDHFNKMIADIFINEKLTIDQRRGIINLIPKQDKDLKYIANWRPISILNTDYKIITKVLANRLKPILPNIISEDQNGFVLGRLIGQNIRIIKDLIDYCQVEDVKGLLVFLDFEKAFDTLNWSFLKHTLKEFNFGPNFTRWVSLLYNDINSSVLNNGFISDSFNLQRGIRQGCPLSAFAFILCAELLANKIKKQQSINGLNIGEFNYKLLQFADDTALIVKDIDSLKESMLVLDEFYKCSGLRLNKTKTIIITLGNNPDDDHINTRLNDINLKLCTESFRYLGIIYDKDEKIMEYKNFRHRLEKIENLLRIWRQRDLSLKGKVTVIKTLALSQLIFPLSMLSAPNWVIDEADKIFLKFLRDCKPRKIKRLTTEKTIAEGGLKMINVDYMAKALKASWVRKIFQNNSNKWTNIPKLYFTDYNFEDFCLTRFDKRSFPKKLPTFYVQCLTIIDEMRTQEPTTQSEVLNEYIWYNKDIHIDRSPVFYKDWYINGVKKVKDLMNAKKDFMSEDELKAKYGLHNFPFVHYHSLRQAIPYSWKQILKKDIIEVNGYTEGKINIKLGDSVVPIDGCPNNCLYWQILRNNNQSIPTAIHYWKNAFQLNDVEMSKAFCVPFRCVRDIKIQSLQYKILHHIYACRLKLYQWKIKPTNNCLTCGDTDTLEHHFFECREALLFWSSLNNWWKNHCNKCTINDKKTVLLGLYNKECHFRQLNYITLKAKWYISRTKYNEESICFLEFLPELINELYIEEIICKKENRNDKFIELWFKCN
jgi:hypothetical protein